MGTNYYADIPGKKCGECGRPHGRTRDLHIGKSSAGWAFVFRGHAGGPATFREWIETLARPKVRIRDEYGARITLRSFLEIVVAKQENINRMDGTCDIRDGYRFSDREFS